LPGGFMNLDESIGACAARELYEETRLKDVYLEQLYTFGAVDRDPRERVISIAFFALIPVGDHTITAGDDARQAKWHPIDNLPDLAFDHARIVIKARQRLADKLEYSTIGLQLMPDEFTLTHLQKIYEAIAGAPRDKRNFRKWILSLDVVQETGAVAKEGAHRPAKLYRVIDKTKIEIIK